MIPLISAQYFNYPDRLSLFLQIFLGYKVKSIKTLSSSSKKDTILIVPFSSLSEKDIANETWIEIIQMALYAYPKIQIHILQNTEGKNIVIPPTVKDRISYVQ
jgi:hypothetical protein